jgi:SNF2 family DNA or RNA helicase
MLRLQQLTGGALDSDEGLPLHRSEEKERALADFLIDLDPAEPVVVFARFRADLDAIRLAARAAGRAVRELSGTRRELAEWQADSVGSVLATQIQSGGEGIDLTRAAHCVYYSLGFSLAQYEQSLARTHRPGQSRPVTYYHLIASGTIDRYVYRTLRQRRDVIDRVLEEGLHDGE